MERTPHEIRAILYDNLCSSKIESQLAIDIATDVFNCVDNNNMGNIKEALLEISKAFESTAELM